MPNISFNGSSIFLIAFPLALAPFYQHKDYQEFLSFWTSDLRHRKNYPRIIFETQIWNQNLQ